MSLQVMYAITPWVHYRSMHISVPCNTGGKKNMQSTQFLYKRKVRTGLNSIFSSVKLIYN